MRLAGSMLLLLPLAGCAGGSTASRADVADLRLRLDEQARRAASAEHKLDELENRVFLLTDQLESQKVAAVHRPTTILPSLPVVTLKPDGELPASDESGGESIEFAGAARSSDPERVRPTLRLDGDAVTRPAAHHPAAHAEELPAINAEGENLGVAAVPPIHAAAGHGGEPRAAVAPPSRAAVAPPSRVAAAPPSRPAAVSEHASVAAERSAPANEPLSLYRAAYDDLRAGRHDEAARQFREFIQRFPRHDYADNAQYWLGEVFYDQKRYDEAAPQFRAVITHWPTGNKAPDAMLKLGFTLLAEGKTAEARGVLRELPSTYPHTEAARLAQARLAQLSSTEETK